MRFSLNFVKEFLSVDVSPQDIPSLLTMVGMEVEHYEKINGDWVFDVEVTTNRYDWLSILGIAREIAASLGRNLKVKYPTITKGSVIKKRDIIIEDVQDCPFYVGREIKGITVGDSSKDFSSRIINCGINSINNVVDITNYCMLKWGNPLHVFDSDKLEGNIYVRRAKEGESFVGIDDKQRNLNKTNLVISDDKKIIALAGIMGAKNTEVDVNTKNVFLEAAIFSPLTIRRSRRNVGLDTESSYRFERMVSPVHLEYASFESAQLIEKLAQGILEGYKQAGRKPVVKRNKICISFSKMEDYLGTSLSKKKVNKILKILDFEVNFVDEDKLSVLSPLSRFDVEREVDVYEEFARIYGYEKIPPRIPFLSGNLKKGLNINSKNLFHLKNELRNFISLLGFREVITFSLEDAEELIKIGENKIIKIANPLRKQENALRTTLFLGIMKSIKHNLNRAKSGLRVFEVADIYFKDKKSFKENQVLGLGVSGELQDVFYLKRVIEDIINYFNVSEFYYKEDNLESFSNILRVFIGDSELGFFGKVNQEQKKYLDLKEDVYFGQLDLSVLINKSEVKKYKPFSLYPEIWRDLSISLRKDIKFAEVEKIIRQDSSYIKNLSVIDVYKGKDLPANCSVFTLRIFYQSQDKTLTSEEVDSYHNKIRLKLSEKEGLTLR